MDHSLLARLHTSSLLFLFSTFWYMTMVSCTGSQISYSDHCSSVVSESTATSSELSISPFPASQTGYFHGGGDTLFNPNSLQFSDNHNVFTFRTHGVCKTNVEEVFKMEANLILHRTSVKDFEKGWHLPPRMRPRMLHFRALDFTLEGFWSRATGKLCMVGWSSIHSAKGDLLNFAAILKLNNVENSSTITSVVTGTLDSLYPVSEPNSFEKISLLMFPQEGYKYTKFSKESDDGCSDGTNVPDNLSLSLPLTRYICSMFLKEVNLFELEYGNSCDLSKNCNPFGDGIGYLPQVMSLSMIQCSKDMQSLRFLVEFPKNSFVDLYHSFNFNTTLVGEAKWNAKKKQLCIVACRIFNPSSSLENSHVGDCTVMISLRLPAIWSIRKTASVSGEIWSTNTVNASTYFGRIMLRDAQSGLIVNGVKYEYTEVDKVRKSFPKKNPISKRRQQFPDANSREMSFDMFVKSSRRKLAWGSSFPLSVGDHPFQRFPYLMPSSSFRPKKSVSQANNRSSSPVNISYQLSITLLAGMTWDGRVTTLNLSSAMNSRVQISSEGVYDDETGNLCMVGCRRLRLNRHIYSNDSLDCEILVNIQFPPLKSGSFIKGSIESTREKSDPLYFETLYLSAAAYGNDEARRSIWRMDMEIVVSVLSNTLACIFIRLQILHVKNHPAVLPSISLLMLVIMALGHLLPLLLNFEALFLKTETVLLGAARWLEVNEVIVRIVTMAAFLLQLRLLQLTWTARWSDAKQKPLHQAEKRVASVCLPVYAAGCLIAFLVKWTNTSQSNDHQQLFLGVSRAYAGLLLDAFLFPQVLFNIFQNSRENALSHLFYIGITIVRLLPHGYNLYREHHYVPAYAGSYIYADPGAGFYSSDWDCIILVLGLLSAAIIHLQQKFGGRWFLPK